MPVFPGCQSVHMYNTQVDQIIYSADPTTTNSLLVDYPSSVYTPVNEEFCLYKLGYILIILVRLDFQ